MKELRLYCKFCATKTNYYEKNTGPLCIDCKVKLEESKRVQLAPQPALPQIPQQPFPITPTRPYVGDPIPQTTPSPFINSYWGNAIGGAGLENQVQIGPAQYAGSEMVLC